MTLILFKLSTCRFQLSLSVSKVYVLNSHLSVRALPVHKKKKKIHNCKIYKHRTANKNPQKYYIKVRINHVNLFTITCWLLKIIKKRASLFGDLNLGVPGLKISVCRGNNIIERLLRHIIIPRVLVYVLCTDISVYHRKRIILN